MTINRRIHAGANNNALSITRGALRRTPQIASVSSRLLCLLLDFFASALDILACASHRVTSSRQDGNNQQHRQPDFFSHGQLPLSDDSYFHNRPGQPWRIVTSSQQVAGLGCELGERVGDHIVCINFYQVSCGDPCIDTARQGSNPAIAFLHQLF